jgi:hypothetical protein
LSAADPPDRPSPPSARPGRDAVDLAIAKALRAAPSVPVAVAAEPDDDAILRVLEGRADPAERARVEAAPLAAEKLAILRDLLTT